MRWFRSLERLCETSMKTSKSAVGTKSRASWQVTAPFARRLVIMVKQPHAGRVKTRLAKQIGGTAATSFYRATSTAVVARLAASSRWQTWLAVAPDHASMGAYWGHHVPRRAQGGGDLGQRMQRIMDWPGRGPIVIVGTDIPAIRPAHIAAAFRALGSNDAVFGPAPDGGYWLVGLRRTPRVLAPFDAVRWSSAQTLSDTAVNLAGRRVAKIAILGDVDGAADFARVKSWCGRRVLAPFSLELMIGEPDRAAC